MDSSLSAAAETLQALTRADGIAIALEINGAIVCRASVGAAPAPGTQLQGAGLSSSCIGSRALVCCADTEDDPAVDAAACRALNLRSAVIAPVLANGVAIGLVACFWAQPHGFDEDAIMAAGCLAAAVARGAQAGQPCRITSSTAPQILPRRVHAGSRAGVGLVLLMALAGFYFWQRAHPSAARLSPRAAPVAAGAIPAVGDAALREAASPGNPVLVTRVEPDYPAGAVARATERDIVLDVAINGEGRVDRVKILDGDPILALAAAAAVGRWRYEATPRSGPAFRMSTRVVLHVPWPATVPKVSAR